MSPASAIYTGRVEHARVRPRRHRLRYRVYWMLLDLDEIDGLARRLWFFSRNRFNLFAFYDHDHRGPASAGLREEIVDALRGCDLGGGVRRIALLSMPRVAGYVFNPLSVYFCYDDGERLMAIVYQVHNTFGERYRYALPVTDGEARPIVQLCSKQFYVSPFLDMELDYTFRVTPPGERLAISIEAADGSGTVLTAALSGARRRLGDRELLLLFLSIPLLTLKVIAGIHWQALILWLKRIGLRPRPGANTFPIEKKSA